MWVIEWPINYSEGQLETLWEQRMRRKALISRFKELNSGRCYMMPLATNNVCEKSFIPPGLSQFCETQFWSFFKVLFFNLVYYNFMYCYYSILYDVYSEWNIQTQDHMLCASFYTHSFQIQPDEFGVLDKNGIYTRILN